MRNPLLYFFLPIGRMRRLSYLCWSSLLCLLFFTSTMLFTIMFSKWFFLNPVHFDTFQFFMSNQNHTWNTYRIIFQADHIHLTLTIIWPLVMLFLVWIRTCLIAQRCHDIGWSGWLSLLSFVPFVSFIFWFILVFAPSEKGDNRYGADSSNLQKTLF